MLLTGIILKELTSQEFALPNSSLAIFDRPTKGTHSIQTIRSIKLTNCFRNHTYLFLSAARRDHLDRDLHSWQMIGRKDQDGSLDTC